MSRKQLGAAPEAESAPEERSGWIARLRAQPGFRTAMVAFVLTVALGVGGPAAYAYWSQLATGTISGTTQAVPAPVVPTPTPTPSTSKPVVPTPTPTPTTPKPAAPAPTPAPTTPKPAAPTVTAPAPAPSPTPSVAPAPTRPALPALTGKAVCERDSAGNAVVSRPTPAGALPASAAVVMTIVDPKGTTVYVVNQTTPIALKNVPGLESRLKGATGTTRMTISFTTGYVTAPLVTAPIGLIDAARILEWSKSPAMATSAGYYAAGAAFIC